MQGGLWLTLPLCQQRHLPEHSRRGRLIGQQRLAGIPGGGRVATTQLHGESSSQGSEVVRLTLQPIIYQLLGQIVAHGAHGVTHGLIQPTIAWVNFWVFA